MKAREWTKLALLAALSACAATPAPVSEEAVKVSQRHAYAICAGSCPEHDLQVRADGRIDVHRIDFDGTDAYETFTVAPSRAVEFATSLRNLRSSAADEASCHSSDTAADQDMRRDVTELAVTWVSSHVDHFEGCLTPARLNTLREAYRALGLTADAERLSR
ncbi:hypothetical protein GRI89_05875 [Altererythrobacter salegens]|uniref:Lipoprotein n=1 Tax=Croceibacterium salegens TaxID=1737568 RepID=A0A6I4SW97_9SPHN|nr:hypothetical protein [Croceibacterium salegens]MXO59066.1 hypothetical protein [Croceibacterium salegens]